MPPADRSRSGTAAAIVAAVFDLIEKRGLQGLTTRDIAAEAGVNVAAVNYHFGSKDQLLAHVLAQAGANAFESIEVEVSSAPDLDLGAQLRAFLERFIRGLAEHPNTSQALIHRLVLGGPAADHVGAQYIGFLRGLTRRVAATRGVAAEDVQVRLDVAGLVSSLVGLALMPGVYAEGLGLDLASPDTVTALIDSLVSPQMPPPSDQMSS